MNFDAENDKRQLEVMNIEIETFAPVKIVFIPCDEEDAEISGIYQSLDGRSLCYVKAQNTLIRCQCNNEIKTGQTSVMCCNICGKPDEDFWCNKDEIKLNDCSVSRNENL